MAVFVLGAHHWWSQQGDAERGCRSRWPWEPRLCAFGRLQYRVRGFPATPVSPGHPCSLTVEGMHPGLHAVTTVDTTKGPLPGSPGPPLLWTPLSALTCCAGRPECPGRPTPAHNSSIFLVTDSCSSCIAFPMNYRYIKTLGNGLAPIPLPRLCAHEDGDPAPPSVPLQASPHMRAPRARNW